MIHGTFFSACLSRVFTLYMYNRGLMMRFCVPIEPWAGIQKKKVDRRSVDRRSVGENFLTFDLTSSFLRKIYLSSDLSSRALKILGGSRKSGSEAI